MDSNALEIEDASNDDWPPELDDVEDALAELDADVVFFLFESVERVVPVVGEVGIPSAAVEYDDGDERLEKRLVSSE